MRIAILLYDWLSTVNIQKTILFLGFYWNFFEEKEELLIPNWGNYEQALQRQAELLMEQKRIQQEQGELKKRLKE